MDYGVNLDNISSKTRTNCVICNTKFGRALIDLPNLPQTGIYVNKKSEYPTGEVNQEVHLCKKCGQVQLKTIVDSKILYGKSYSFRTSESPTAPKANDIFISFIKRIMSREGVSHFDRILEVGCNDGYLLDHLKGIGEKSIGIDPILNGREEEFFKRGIVALGNYEKDVDLTPYLKDGINAIISSDTLEHMEDPRGTIKRLLGSSNEENLFFFHFPGLEGLVKDSRFDQIIHQHLNYFSVHSFNYLINELGGELIASETNPDYWSTLLLAFRKKERGVKKITTKKISREEILKSYDFFRERMKRINSWIKSSNTDVYGYGAGAIVPMLNYHGGVDFSELEGIIDDDPNKSGLFYLGEDIPIINPVEREFLKNSRVVITAIDNSRNILQRLLKDNPKEIVLLKEVL